MATSSGRDLPRGIEVLVKKAAVDAEFRALLLDARAGAAGEIGLDLDPAEAAMLEATTAAQLEAIIASTKVDDHLRLTFLRGSAAQMVAVLERARASALMEARCGGIRPDRPPARGWLRGWFRRWFR